MTQPVTTPSPTASASQDTPLPFLCHDPAARDVLGRWRDYLSPVGALWVRRGNCVIANRLVRPGLCAEAVALLLPGPRAPQKDGAKGRDDRNTVERALGPPNKAYGDVDRRETDAAPQMLIEVDAALLRVKGLDSQGRRADRRSRARCAPRREGRRGAARQESTMVNARAGSGRRTIRGPRRI
jgi:hypothetical protein